MPIKPRSLATVLSKLDREVDLSWLQDRTDVQVVLARRLGCPVESISSQSDAGLQVAPERQLRWTDLRYARPLDLGQEALPPAIPEAVLDPLSWGRVWWRAPSGSGRSLVGRWLSARGLARHVKVMHLAEASDELRNDVPTFLEVESVQQDDALPERDRLCVAAPFPAPNADWRSVETSPVRAQLEDAVRWAAARLPKDSDFDPDSAIAWLSGRPLQEGELDGLGTVLGLCGALDELGMRETKNARVLDLCPRFVRRRLDETYGAGSSDVSWLRRNALDVLVGMARRTLTDDDEPFSTPRTMDEWMALIPEQFKSGLEVEWLRLSLSQIDTSIRPVDIERAARRMSPGAFRIVRALATARLLVAEGDRGELVPSPRWLAAAVSNAGRRSLLSASPFEWGEGLLRPHAAAAIAQDLLARFESSDTTALSDVLELEAGDNASHAASLETAFRAAGLALLSGADIDTELLLGVWEEQSELMIRPPDAPPMPRIEHAGSNAPLLSRGAWHLAALSISERLQGDARPAGSPLSPWSADQAMPGLSSVLDSVLVAARSARAAGASWGLDAYALVERLRSTLGSVDPKAPHAMERPAILLDAVLNGACSWASITSLDPGDFDVLPWLWSEHGSRKIDVLATALWNAWNEAQRPELTTTLLHPDSPVARLLWPGLPPKWTPDAIEKSGPAAPRILHALIPAQWQALIGAEVLARDPDLRHAICAAIPESEVERWLGVVSDERVVHGLWQRFPELLERLSSEQARSGRTADALRLLVGAPKEHVGHALVAFADDPDLESHLDTNARRQLVMRLHLHVARRAAQWRTAYELLSRLER